MKKCSQPAHHALTELNIAPLLDLGFVLLVIFIITTTPIINDLDVKLPVASQHSKDPPRKANYITLQTDGTIYLNSKPVSLSDLQPALAQIRRDDPDLTLIVRGDAKSRCEQFRAVLKACQKANILKVDLATEASVPNS